MWAIEASNAAAKGEPLDFGSCHVDIEHCRSSHDAIDTATVVFCGGGTTNTNG